MRPVLSEQFDTERLGGVYKGKLDSLDRDRQEIA